MGGFGSGRTASEDRKLTNEFVALDIVVLQQAGALTRGSRWSRDLGNGMCIGGGMTDRGMLVVWGPVGKDKQTVVKQVVELSYTDYCGKRAWFHCPKSRCKRRCRKLYLVQDGLACRICLNLAYESDHWTDWERCEQRAMRIRLRLYQRLPQDERTPEMLKFGNAPACPRRMNHKRWMVLVEQILDLERRRLGDPLPDRIKRYFETHKP